MSNIKPTSEEVAAEAKKLREMKPNVRRYSAFGDDHWRSIDAQLQVLEKDLDEDDISDRFGDNPDIEDSALEARRWIDGESEEGPPSEGWQSLVK